MGADLVGLVNLTRLMARSSGRAEVAVGLIDGPVAASHRELAGSVRDCLGACQRVASAACRHGTLVAGILSADRSSDAPGICPGCTLLVRPIFEEVKGSGGRLTAAPAELAEAFVECVDSGAWVINVSAVVTRVFTRSDAAISSALDYAARRGVVVVAAAGNDAIIGSSPVTRHRWAIPVAACDSDGAPLATSNLGSSIGRRGVRAPGLGVTSLAATGGSAPISGSSAAAAFVTGTVALLWSIFPNARPGHVIRAVTQAQRARLRSVVPPLLDAWSAYVSLRGMPAGARNARRAA